MLIKTNSLPPSLAADAQRLHGFLLAPPACDWSLEFRGPRSPGLSPETLTPVLTIYTTGQAAEYASKVDSFIYPTQLGQRILDRKQPIQLGGAAVRMPELDRVRLNQSSLANGYLTLPPLSVELAGLPDPMAVGLQAERGRRSFLIHLRGRVSGAPLEVRLTF